MSHTPPPTSPVIRSNKAKLELESLLNDQIEGNYGAIDA